MHEHTTSPRLYYMIFAALLGLLALTVLVAYLNLGAWSPLVAMLIASVKALLVVLYFMHVRYNNRLTWVFAGAGFVWLALLLVLTMSDYLSRNWVGL
ncbi:MAG: cytochrome C oxidase subunit IV family protein [Chloroflexota bacterium]|nr:cytochrome C oxidase subunit IV family protein [Chloroflexota bacterium]